MEQAKLPREMPLIEFDGEARIPDYIREGYQQKCSYCEYQVDERFCAKSCDGILLEYISCSDLFEDADRFQHVWVLFYWQICSMKGTDYFGCEKCFRLKM